MCGGGTPVGKTKSEPLSSRALKRKAPDARDELPAHARRPSPGSGDSERSEKSADATTRESDGNEDGRVFQAIFKADSHRPGDTNGGGTDADAGRANANDDDDLTSSEDDGAVDFAKRVTTPTLKPLVTP